MRSIWTLLVVPLAALVACESSDRADVAARTPSQAELEAVWEEAQPIIEDELAKEEARSAVRFPCTIMDKEAASTLLSADLEAPAFAHEYKTDSNIDTGETISWEAEACSWNNRGDGASLNIWVSQPQQFKDGRVSCQGIYEEDITEPFLDGKAKWEYLESFAWAKLLVCRDDVLFFIELHDGPSNEAEARAIAIGIADEVVAALLSP